MLLQKCILKEHQFEKYKSIFVEFKPTLSFFYFIYFDKEIDTLSYFIVQGPNFITEHLILDTQTSLQSETLIPRTTHFTLVLHQALHLLSPGHLISFTVFTPFRIHRPSNPATLSHLWIMNPLGILKVEMDHLLSDTYTPAFDL